VFGVTVTFVALLEGYSASRRQRGVARHRAPWWWPSLAVLALDHAHGADVFNLELELGAGLKALLEEWTMQKSRHDVWVGCSC
jgi:hypothetical protein